jgi:formamidase
MTAPQEDSGPRASQGWGYTGMFATKNGGGFLTEWFPDAYKVVWDFRGGVAISRHVPGVSYVGIVHPGLMGTAPPRENGGNQDIKNFTKGTRVFYPVFVHGANLSVGDLHCPRATARSRSAVQSRWADSSTWAST